ncbi:MAG: hypothetical protein FJW14_18015 [Acidimicrobiia bacterium]|nr:hypothetical protein [Acidimicrobiia bacterium]
MTWRLLLLALGAGLALTGPSVRAHHSFAVAFDAGKPITVEGIVTRVQWESPHSWIFLDVKDASGKVVNWGFEGWPPAMLTRRGATPQILKPGVPITVKGYRARDASRNLGAAIEIVFPGGKSIGVGAGPDTGRGRRGGPQ